MSDAINKISQQTAQLLKNKSIKGMAINPSEKGASPQQIQNAMFEPYIGDTLSLLTELNRIVNELNSKFVTVDSGISTNANDISDAKIEYRAAITLINNAIDLINIALAGKQETSNLYDGLDSNDSTKYLSAKQGKVLKQLVDGKKKAFTYNDIPSMITDLNSLSATELKTGDDLYIIDTEVPDFWVKEVKSGSSTYTYTNLADLLDALNSDGYIQVGYYEIAKLETEKVDLSNYQPKGTFELDTATTNIHHTLALYEEKSYRANGISSIQITIPTGIEMGFYSGVNFRIGNTAPSLAISISPKWTVKLINLGIVVDSFQPSPNSTLSILAYCDGIFLYLYINEVF